MSVVEKLTRSSIVLVFIKFVTVLGLSQVQLNRYVYLVIVDLEVGGMLWLSQTLRTLAIWSICGVDFDGSVRVEVAL
jgi:hypothetical protein